MVSMRANSPDCTIFHAFLAHPSRIVAPSLKHAILCATDYRVALAQESGRGR